MLVVLESAGSVLDVAWKMVAESKLAVFDAVMAYEQTAGRGQYGRTWISPKGNVYAAVRLPCIAPFDNMEAALALSCCILATLSDFGFEAKIKWTNDLVIDGGKVAGILLEQKGDKLVAGIGINVLSCPELSAMRQDAALPATCLRDVNPELVSRLTPKMVVEDLLKRLKNLNLAQFSRQWRALALSRLLWLNEPVCIEIDGEGVVGVLAGIDAHGGLLLATEDGVKSFIRGTLRNA